LRILVIARLILAFIALDSQSYGYTVLTHEAIIDSVWNTSLRQLLRSRFPSATPEELVEAHAYAYGGCIIQDLGYYPFSSHFFSDLTHYVRSGDFILELIRQSQDLNEYAFALGALEHYAADNEGHRIATNRAVPILYPKLRRKFGTNVTYDDDPKAHMRTEFGFDVVQIALGRYAPDQYHDFIGFKVSKDVLERAFVNTYGVPMKDVFASVDLSLGTYRYTVSSVIPNMTRVAWTLKQEELKKEIPGVTRKKFLFNLSRSSYEKKWGKDYHKPGCGTKILAFFIRILPPVGPFSALRIRTPTPEVEKLFMGSFNATVVRYKALLANAETGLLDLPNENLDLGEPPLAGKYKGADAAYEKLVGKLADKQFADVSPELRQNILGFYQFYQFYQFYKDATPDKLIEQLDRLKAMP
jgi:hypothetical protein